MIFKKLKYRDGFQIIVLCLLANLLMPENAHAYLFPLAGVGAAFFGFLGVVFVFVISIALTVWIVFKRLFAKGKTKPIAEVEADDATSTENS